MKKLLAIATVATMTISPVFAGVLDFVPTGLELGVGVSATSGLNGVVGYINKTRESFWLKRIGVRADFATTKPLKSTINSLVDSAMGDGVDVGDNLTITDGSIESKHLAAMLDFYPFGDTWFLGGWRISGGYVFGDAKITADLTADDDALDSFAGQKFQLGDTLYCYTGGGVHGKAKMKWDFSGPYLGTGFDIGLFGGFKLFVDAGVVFTSKAAELSLDIPNQSGLKYSTDNGDSWSTVDVQGQIDTDTEEVLEDAQDELDKYKFYPMVKMGFMYRF